MAARATEGLDSAAIASLEACRGVLDDRFRRYRISATQYRLLLVALDGTEPWVPMAQLAGRARLAPNTAVQAVGALERLGLVEKAAGSGDGRSRSMAVAEDGRAEVDASNAALASCMHARFNPHGDATFDEVLTRGLRDATSIGGLWSPELRERYVTSAALTAVDAAMGELEGLLRREAGVSLSEARILQRLAEVGEPMRSVDLVRQLQLPATTITRAAGRLEAKGALVRLSSTENLKAVFLDVAPEGRPAQEAVLRVMDGEGWRAFWGPDGSGDTASIQAIEQMFECSMRLYDEDRHRQVLSSLRMG